MNPRSMLKERWERMNVHWREESTEEGRNYKRKVYRKDGRNAGRKDANEERKEHIFIYFFCNVCLDIFSEVFLYFQNGRGGC